MLQTQLDGGLVGLASRVAEEGLVEAGRVLDEPRRQGPLVRDVVQVAHVVHLLDLFRDRVDEALVAVAQAAGADARHEVQVRPPGVVFQFAAAAPDNRDRVATVRLLDDVVKSLARRDGGVGRRCGELRLRWPGEARRRERSGSCDAVEEADCRLRHCP